MTESWVGALASVPGADLVYAIARSSGFSEDNIEIHDLDKLPSGSIEVVVALQGVEVPGRRSLGPVTLRAI